MAIRAFLLESLGVFKAITLRRLMNLFCLAYSYLKSYYTHKTQLIGKPFAFAIEPTSICNLKCPECPTGVNLLKRPRGTMDLSLFRKLLTELSPDLFYLNLYIQGEPLMHPEFGKMVKEAARFKLYTSTSTNGHFMNPSLATQLVENRLTRIIFSVDGTSQESYGVYRVGGNFSKVKTSINQIVEAKKKQGSLFPIVVMQFLVFHHNEHELPEIQRLARQLKVDKLEIKTAQLNSFGKLRPPINARYSRYADELGKILKRKTNNRCWRQWHSATVTWDGRFAPCCYDKDAEHAFGDALKQDINQIWNGRKSLVFKDEIFKNRQEINMCNNCPEGKHLF